MSDLSRIDWKKMEGLLPAVVQDADTLQVLMLGYMSPEALEKTQASGHVTFQSRSRGGLWTKGETSGHYLELVDIALDCDGDALLVQARPIGPTCHRLTTSCFGASTAPGIGFLGYLARVIAQRAKDKPEGSYTVKLLEAGVPRAAQKVGEEAVETVIAAVRGDMPGIASESADLLYHLLVLFQITGSSLNDALTVLRTRHK